MRKRYKVTLVLQGENGAIQEPDCYHIATINNVELYKYKGWRSVNQIKFPEFKRTTLVKKLTIYPNYYGGEIEHLDVNLTYPPSSQIYVDANKLLLKEVA